jgi:uncharacterized membrane protein YfcA
VIFLAILLAFVVGATLGLFGGGGAVLTLPIFVYVLGVPAKSAVAMSFLVIGAASTVGAVDRWRQGRLDPSKGILFGIAAVVGAFGGGLIGARIPVSIQMSMFGAAVVVSAVSMLVGANREEETHAPKPVAIGVILFALIGAFTSIVGVGGGFLFVPALVGVVGVSMIDATSLSLMIVAMNAISSFSAYYGKVDIDWKVAGIFAASVIAVMLPAGNFARRVPVPILKRSFALVLLAVGTYVLIDHLRR